MIVKMDRRKFLKANLGALALTAVPGSVLTGCSSGRTASKGTMRLSFEPYELQLRHTFTVASYSRKTTPGVQVRIDYDGFTGYGEASMPPYLGQSVQTVTDFLKKVDLSRFSSPFLIDDIL